MNGKTTIILGGGSGGVVVANKLRKKLNPEHRIVLINKEDNHIFYPSLPWLIFGWRRPEQIQRNLNSLNKKGIEFLKGAVQKIHTDKKSVVVNDKEIPYDYLVASLGAGLDETPFPKNSKICNFYGLEGAKMAQNALREFSSGKIVILISAIPFKCPAAPYELAFLVDSFFKNKGIRSNVEIKLYTPETLPMPTAGPKLGNKLKDMLEKRGIRYNTGHKFESVSEREIIFGDNKKAEFDLLLVVPPHRSPLVVKESGLSNESGWIPVDGETLKTNSENVYAIGDITSIKLPGQYESDKPLNLPKAGVFAHYQAEVVAENIASEIIGKKPDKKFTGNGYCIIELGNNIATFAQGNFYSLPRPHVTMYPPLRIWHWSRVWFKKWWLRHWF